MAGADDRLQEDGSDEAFVDLQQHRAELFSALSNEEQFWRQKSRVKWLWLGDQNSRYFHSVVRQHRFRALIHRIRDGSGNWITDDNAIGAEAVRYFGDLFSAGFVPNFLLLHVIPNISTMIDNGKLEQVPSMEEVKKVIFDMDGDSAAGPDGFTGKFFYLCMGGSRPRFV